MRRVLLLLAAAALAATAPKPPPAPRAPPECAEVQGPIGPQLCCGDRCFPSFVVIGAQKTGSTSLLAMLSQHSLVRAPSKKESHFFDKRLRPRDAPGPRDYLSLLPALQPAAEITGEATPGYLAQAGPICRDIRALMPRAKLVALLRDPADRSFSELEMKRRRIDAQEALRESMAEHASAVHACLTDPRVVTLAELRACLPVDVSENIKFKAFAHDMLHVDKRGGPEANVQKAARRVAEACYTGLQFQRKCLGRSPRLNEGMPEPARSVGAELGFFSQCEARGLARGETADERLTKLAHCWPHAQSGLGRGFVQRSLYAPLLQDCGFDNLLVVDSDLLRSRPQEALARILEHIGLPAQPINTDEEFLAEVVRQQFPLMESTGWTLRGEYEPLAPSLRDSLDDFFAPFNAMLLRLRESHPGNFVGDFAWAGV